MMVRHGEHLRESGDARAEVLEDGEGQLMLRTMRDGLVRDSFARGAYGDGPPRGGRSALRKRNWPRAARRKVSWERHGEPQRGFSAPHEQPQPKLDLTTSKSHPLACIGPTWTRICRSRGCCKATMGKLESAERHGTADRL